MWTSERNARRKVEEPAAELGQVTLGGAPAGVSLGGERRWLPLCTPGGYAWRPAAGERVLVLKAGGERESPCVLGTVREQEDLAPGAVRLSSGGGVLSLAGGNVDLRGRVLVNGTALESWIKEIVAEEIGKLMGG